MTIDRDIEITYALPEFIAELRRLADALESGELFDLDGEQIAIPDDAVFLIEHERDEDGEEISFELKWVLLDDEDEDENENENEDGDEEEDADDEADAASTPA